MMKAQAILDTSSWPGRNDNRLSQAFFDVREFEGRQGVLEIVDDEKGAWGNIGVGRIVFTFAPWQRAQRA